MEPVIQNSDMLTTYAFTSENAYVLFSIHKVKYNNTVNETEYIYENNNNYQYNNKEEDKSIEETPTVNKEIEISFFTSKVKGAGKKLLCEALAWIQKNLPTIEIITLGSVPLSNIVRKRGISKANAQEKLNTYYKSLGFTPYGNSTDHYFKATVQTILQTACTAKGGTRKSKKRKSRKY